MFDHLTNYVARQDVLAGLAWLASGWLQLGLVASGFGLASGHSCFGLVGLVGFSGLAGF